MNAIGRPGSIRLGEALGSFFNLGDGVGIEQLAQVGFAKQFAQLILVDGQSLRATFGQRRITVVDKVGHVTEQQR